MIPKKGTLERVMMEKLLESKNGCTFLDFVGTGITEENIEQVANNLRYGMYESEFDDSLKQDA